MDWQVMIFVLEPCCQEESFKGSHGLSRCGLEMRVELSLLPPAWPGNA
jgi:hypothetical protein